MNFHTNTLIKVQDEPYPALYFDVPCDVKDNIKQVYIPFRGKVNLNVENLPIDAGLGISSRGTPVIIGRKERLRNMSFEGTVWFGVASTDMFETSSGQLTVNVGESTATISESMAENLSFKFDEPKVLWVKRARGNIQSSIGFILYLPRTGKLVFNVGESWLAEFSCKDMPKAIARSVKK